MLTLDAVHSVADLLARLKSDALSGFFNWPYQAQPGHAHVRYQRKFGIWFRGQSNAAWKLIPSVFPRHPAGPFIDESASTYHFMLRAAANSAYNFHNTFDWLCLMQHYNCPTRLLDWTENLLVGLYFACQDGNEKTERGILYILNTVKLNIVTRAFPAGRSAICLPDSPEVAMRAELTLVVNRQDFSDHLSSVASRDFVAEAITIREIRERLVAESRSSIQPGSTLDCLRKPIAVLPFRRHPRMTLQQSGFTLHGGKSGVLSIDPSEELPSPMALEDLNDYLDEPKAFLCAIPVENKDEIKEELELMGIHGATLFPEPEYQTEFVKSRWSYSHVPKFQQ